MVNKAVMYDPNDFLEQESDKKGGELTEEEQKAIAEMNEKLDKFIDRVAFRIEEALQSNEIINVF